MRVSAAAPGAAQYGQGFGKNKIQYREFDWQIYHSPHFDVYYYADEAPLLEKVVSFAESAYDRLAREFDHQIAKPIPLIFYATHSAFEQNNIILNSGLAAGRFTRNVAICLWQGSYQDTVLNNTMYNGGANPVVFEQTAWDVNTPVSVATFNTLSGGSWGHVISGNIGSDPLLAGDFTLRSGSPCIQAGVNVGLTRDYLGNVVPSTSRPEVGACQAQSGKTASAEDRAGDAGSEPRTYALGQNYPNPFNPSTQIEFSLPREARATLEVYNIVGQRVAVLVDDVRQAGVHRVAFSGQGLASGVYIYRLKAAGETMLTKKMTLVK